MKRTIKRKQNLYDVDCISEGGVCYVTHLFCDWDAVKSYRRIARMLGETIRYEKSGTKEYTYTL